MKNRLGLKTVSNRPITVLIDREMSQIERWPTYILAREYVSCLIKTDKRLNSTWLGHPLGL